MLFFLYFWAQWFLTNNSCKSTQVMKGTKLHKQMHSSKYLAGKRPTYDNYTSLTTVCSCHTVGFRQHSHALSPLVGIFAVLLSHRCDCCLRVKVRLRESSQDHSKTQSHTVEMNKHQVENKYKAELSSAHKVPWRISEGTHPSTFVPAVGLHVPPRLLDSLAPESGAEEDLYLQDMNRRNSTQEAWYTHRQTCYILWTNRSPTPQQHKHPQDRNTLSLFLWTVGVFRALNLCYNANLHKQCCYFVFKVPAFLFFFPWTNNIIIFVSNVYSVKGDFV